MFVIGHYQLGPLYVHKKQPFLTQSPTITYLAQLVTHCLLAVAAGKTCFPALPTCLQGRFIRPSLRKADMRQTATLLSEGSDLVAASRRLRHRWVFFFFFFFSVPEAQTESMLHHTPPQGAKEERQIHPIHFRKLVPSLKIIDHFQSDVLTERGRC